MTRRLPTIAWIVTVWLIASESFTIAGVAAAIVAALVLTTLFRHEMVSTGPTTFRPVAVLRFVAYFLAKLARANAQVALAVISPSRVKRRRGIVAVPITECSETIVWFLANAVSLTPGTSIVELKRDPDVFYVHVLLLTSVAEVQQEVLHMQRHLLLAFGPVTAVDDVDRRIARLATGATTSAHAPQ